MIHNLQITLRVQVNDVSQEDYEKIIKMVVERQEEGFGLEDFELGWILDPNKIKRNGGKPRKTFFPATIEYPDMNRDDVLPQTTKIELIG
jgi:hypothetical protein